MITISQMDDRVPFIQQLQDQTGPVVLVNVFTIPPGRLDDAITVWAEDAAFMKRQPGFISTQLHRGTAGSNVLVNVALWESAEDLGRAFTSPEFQAKTERYPDGTVATPHVFERVAVKGICVGEVAHHAADR